MGGNEWGDSRQLAGNLYARSSSRWRGIRLTRVNRLADSMTFHSTKEAAVREHVSRIGT